MALRFKNLSCDDLFEARHSPPTHYSFKIHSFSSFSNASIDKYRSDKFEAGDCKWKLTIYPSGNEVQGGEGHISIYLTLLDTSLLPVGWEVQATFNLLVLDQTRDKYCYISDGKVRRFHEMKTEWGIAKFIELEIFNDASNGYLINDTCVFGVDVFVLKQSRRGEFLSLTKEPVTGSFSWKIKSFSALTSELYDSESFVVGNYKWRIRLYPRGFGDGKGNSISVYLSLDQSSLPPNTKLFVKYVLRVLDQNHTNPDHFESEDDNHFGPPFLSWGEPKFMSMAKFSNPKKGYLVDNQFSIEAQISLIGTVSSVQ